MEEKNKEYVLTGTCQPDKCNAFCCRINVVYSYSKKDRNLKYVKDNLRYYSYFGFQVEEIPGKICIYQLKTCSKLKNNRCSIYKNRPTHPCRVFPQDKDMAWYILAKNHGCTLKFVLKSKSASKKYKDIGTIKIKEGRK